MTKLYLKYEEFTSGGGIVEGQENDSWPDYNDSYVHFEPISLHLERPDTTFPEEFEVDFEVEPGDELYLIIPRYGDGDTFSYTDGYWIIYGATKDSTKAVELEDAIVNDKIDDSLEALLPVHKDEGSRWGRYVPWGGYFSRGSLSVDISKLLVR